MKRSATGRWAGCTLLTLAMATGTIGCGSGSSSSTGSTPPITPTAASTAVLVNMGDTPSDSVLECAVTIAR